MAPSAVKTTSGTHFEAMYEAPYAGVASENYPTDINPSNMVTATGVNIRQGVITSEFWSAAESILASGITAGAIVLAIANISGNLYCWDNQGVGYLYNVSTKAWQFDLSVPSLAPVEIDCIQIINGSAYMFNYAAGLMYQYTPVGMPSPTYQVFQTYAAGLYCCVVDGYLLTANSNQPTDTPAIKTGRVNWSSPYQFGQWDPAANRNAGYNVLADVQDFITGIFALGNVAYVLRTNGMTQLTPTGVAIQPFDFPTLLGGDFGIGCTFPDTLSVYGSIAAFGDSTDFYLFGGSTPQGICGMAKSAIYTDINNFYQKYKTGVVSSLISAAFSNASYNNIIAELCYTICIVQQATNIAGGPPNYKVVFWSYTLMGKYWTRNVFDLGGYFDSLYATEAAHPTIGTITNAQLIHLKFPNTFNKVNPAFTFPVFFFSGLINVPNGSGGFVSTAVNLTLNVYRCLNGMAIGTFSGYIAPFTIQYKQEEVRLGRQPSIRRVVFKAAGVGTILVQVGNATFTPVVINNASFMTYTSSGFFTGEDPQLMLSSTNFYGTIVKAMMTGSYADGDYD